MIVLDCSRQSTSLWEYAFVVSYYLLSRHLRKGFLDLGVRLVILIKCAKFLMLELKITRNWRGCGTDELLMRWKFFIWKIQLTLRVQNGFKTLHLPSTFPFPYIFTQYPWPYDHINILCIQYHSIRERRRSHCGWLQATVSRSRRCLWRNPGCGQLSDEQII